MKKAGLSRISPSVLKPLRPSIRRVAGEQSEQAVTRLGGYPNRVQYSKLKPTDDWQLLMQLDSEDEAGMMWGDVGKLYFTILEHDLSTVAGMFELGGSP